MYPQPALTPERLKILYLTPMPPSPPRFGGQMRMHGLMTAMARRHDVSAVSLVDSSFDATACERAMREYCKDVALVPNARAPDGAAKRLLQLRSMVSRHSFEHRRYGVPGLQSTLDRILGAQRFDVVDLEFPYLARYRLRQAPPGQRVPPLVLDTHEIEYDILRQVAASEAGLQRRVYNSLNWRKMRREERQAFLGADGIAVCSAVDRDRLLADAPSARTRVVPNAADVEFFQPRPGDPRPDGKTVLFFGTLGYFPNVDGVLFFLREVWPRIAQSHPEAVCKIIGPHPPQEVQAHRGPRVEIAGFVDDLRPHIAQAAALVVPLRIGGGTRLKIVEGMAMAKPIVSTRLGAEGIDAEPEREILLADEPQDFARAVGRVLDDKGLASRLGQAARKLAVERYSWTAASLELERLYREVIEARP